MRVASLLCCVLLTAPALAEEVQGTLLLRGGVPRLDGREVTSDDPRLSGLLRAWVGRDVTLEGEPGPDGGLRVTRVLAPREVSLSGWVAHDHEGGGALVWCAPDAVWRAFGPGLEALRAAHGRRVRVDGWTFRLNEVPDGLCVEGVEPEPVRAEPRELRGVLGPAQGVGDGGFALSAPDGVTWQLLIERGRSPLPAPGRLCGRELGLSGLALPAGRESEPRAFLVERAPSVELTTLTGALREAGLETTEGLLPLPAPCTAHGGLDPGRLLERLRGQTVALRGRLLRDAQGRARELVVEGALAQDDAGHVVLIEALDADGTARGALDGEPQGWPFARLRFTPAAPPPKRIPGH